MEPVDPAADVPRPGLRDRLKARWPSWGTRAVFECGLIVFSVLLALALSNWAEDRRMDGRVAEARAFFVEEIRANREILAQDAYLPHHRRLRNIFSEAATRPDLSRETAMPPFMAMFRTGLHLAPLRDAVWRSVQSGELLGEMPLEEVFVLSDIYRQQDQLERQNQAFIATIPAMLTNLEAGAGVRAAVTNAQLNLGDIVAMEQQLIELYDKALVELDDTPPAATARPRDGKPPAG